MEQMKRGLEAEMDDQQWCAPVELQHWLQLSFERERIAFEKKQIAAREQFTQAREMVGCSLHFTCIKQILRFYKFIMHLRGIILK